MIAPGLPRLQLLLLAATAAAAPGCALHQPMASAPAPADLPDAYSRPSADGKSVDRWWREFGDRRLEELIDRALAGNLDLRQAWSRLVQARAVVRQTASARWPQFTLDTGVTRSQSVISTSQFGGLGASSAAASVEDGAAAAVEPTPESISVRNDVVPLTLGASYEVDLWRRIASQTRAAELDLAASRHDLEAAAITLASPVADTWFALTEQRAQHKLLAEQIKVSQTFLDLTRHRFGQGQASALDVYQQRQQVANTQAQVPTTESQLQVAAHRLDLLLGRPARDVTLKGPAALPGLPALPDAGTPARLLTRRPDVRAAGLRAAAADQRVAAAIADRFPAVRVGASTGYQSTDVNQMETLFDNWIWSLSANLTWPVFDGGRRQAEVDRTRAAVHERLLAFRKALLTALREVEDAFVQERKQQELVSHIQVQVRLAKDTLREARARYVNGLSDYLPVLTALQSLQNLERNELIARRQLLVFRIQLYRALGGAWPRELEPKDAPATSARAGDTP